MGLATGVEVKSEPLKTEDVVTVAPVEEIKTIMPHVETTSVPLVTTSVEALDAAEVTLCSLTVSKDYLIFLFFFLSQSFFMSFRPSGSRVQS